MLIIRYLALCVLTRSAASFVLFVAVYSAVDFVEVGSRLGSLGDLAGARGHLELLALYPLRLPMIASHVLPLSLVIGAQMALSSLRSRGEWVSLRSAGFSPARLAFCLLVVPFAGVLFSSVLLAEISPRALNAWQSSFDLGAKEPRHRWCVKGDVLVKEKEGSGLILTIERDDNGAPKRYWAGSERAATSWTKEDGWLPGARQRYRAECEPYAAKSAMILLGFEGASLTFKELAEESGRARDRGRSAAPLKAEAALRTALAAACLIVPLLALGFSLGGEEPRATRLVAKGLAAAAAYWFFLAAAWNGAVIGAWSSAWVSIAVPLVFFATGSALTLINGRR